MVVIVVVAESTLKTKTTKTLILKEKLKKLRASNIMKKTQIDTVNIRHGLTPFFAEAAMQGRQIYTVFFIHFSVSSVFSVAKTRSEVYPPFVWRATSPLRKLCGEN